MMTAPRTDKRIRDAVEVGLLAFWEKVAPLFPEITSGDCDPGVVVAFDMAAKRAIEDVLYGNMYADEIATMEAVHKLTWQEGGPNWLADSRHVPPGGASSQWQVAENSEGRWSVTLLAFDADGNDLSTLAHSLGEYEDVHDARADAQQAEDRDSTWWGA